MRVKMILPALVEAKSQYYRSLKYSLFPPLGLATLAAFLREDDEVELQDEHVETLRLQDAPELVVIQVYTSAARRAYALADHYRANGAYVCLGGLHVTACPEEAARHADSIFLGPGEDVWPSFLADFRAGHPLPRYQSRTRSLHGQPPLRRDLIKRHLYLMPNSLVVSRGCPHACDFCYKTSFYAGGPSYYMQTVDAALEEIARLPGRHLYFLDDHLFGNRPFAETLFDGMRGMGRVWQAAATVQSVLEPGLLEAAVASGLRSLFIGFETLNAGNLTAQHKFHNRTGDYATAIRRLHDLGVMVNASFVFGLDEDDDSVFARTTDWAIAQGIETSTFHILTPYPGTALHARLLAQGRILSSDWNLYDTRHAVFTPGSMTPAALEEGYWRSYRDFYRWPAILNSAMHGKSLPDIVRHLAFAGLWKKAEPLWELLINMKRIGGVIPLLETMLAGHQQRAHHRMAPGVVTADKKAVSGLLTPKRSTSSRQQTAPGVR